jgi:methyl-accepting chemotaxis protein-1 (serine sensor receptor)
MEIGYRRGFEAFEATGSDASVGSDAVAAVGGASAALVDKPRGKYAADSTLVSSGAGDHARRSSITSVALMLMMLTLALIGAYGFSRTTSRALARALGCAQTDITVSILLHDPRY